MFIYHDSGRGNPCVKTKECKDHRLYIATPPGRDTGKGHKHRTGLLISNDWKCIPLPFLGISIYFESNSVTITHPFKIHFIVVYRPLGPQGNFLDELDVLLLTFPEDGIP